MELKQTKWVHLESKERPGGSMRKPSKWGKRGVRGSGWVLSHIDPVNDLRKRNRKEKFRIAL